MGILSTISIKFQALLIYCLAALHWYRFGYRLRYYGSGVKHPTLASPQAEHRTHALVVHRAVTRNALGYCVTGSGHAGFVFIPKPRAVPPTAIDRTESLPTFILTSASRRSSASTAITMASKKDMRRVDLSKEKSRLVSPVLACRY